MNQAAAPLVRIMAGYESDRRGQSLSLSISQTDIPREHHPPVPHACVRTSLSSSHQHPQRLPRPSTPSVSNAAVKRTTRYGLWKHAGKRLCHAIGYWQCEAGAREDFKFVIGIGYVPAGLLNHSRHRRGLRDQH
jgi:hypothetical protein